MKEVVIILLLSSNFYGLEGQKVCFSQKNLEEKVVLSPLIIKGKVRSKFESQAFTEVIIKFNKVYKDNGGIIKKHSFLRLRFNCEPKIRLGGNYVFFISSKELQPIENPEKMSKKLKKTIRKLSCKGCSKYHC